MTITVLVENTTSRPDLVAEHGLSLWIETTSGAILFDTGRSDAFASNAQVLDIDISKAAAVVLSHGHYDHAGGLARAVAATSCPVYLASDAIAPRRARGADGMRDIGMDPATVRGLGERLRLIDERREILDGVELLTAAPVISPPPGDNARLLREHAHGCEPDSFTDERSLLIQEPADRRAGESAQRLPAAVLITGCSHRGIGNIYRDARRALGGAAREITVVGGLHLSHEPAEAVLEAAELLQDAPRLVVGHCTGDDALRILSGALPGRVERLQTGTRLTVGAGQTTAN